MEPAAVHTVLACVKPASLSHFTESSLSAPNSSVITRPEWARNLCEHLLQSLHYYPDHTTTLMAATLHHYEIANECTSERS